MNPSAEAPSVAASQGDAPPRYGEAPALALGRPQGELGRRCWGLVDEIELDAVDRERGTRFV